MVHGVLGFNEVKLCGWTFKRYFPGIVDALEKAGNRVLVPQLSPTRGVADRAAELKRFIDRQSPEEPVHILGHSMGGLDARYMISRLGMEDRVLSLTTIGTPHRGSSFADWGMRRFERLLKPVFDMCDLPRQAFYDLTTTGCRRFNAEVPNAPRVRYFSVAGRHERSWRSLRWRLLHKIVSDAEGPNDGVVSLTSAHYGESCEVWDGDHLELVNWPNPGVRGRWEDRTNHYARLVGRLADEGF
jgi:triacylglycerol lipase